MRPPSSSYERPIDQATLVLDLAAAENAGKAVGCSDKHYGHPRNLINPGRYVRTCAHKWPCHTKAEVRSSPLYHPLSPSGINMGDGWETARKMTRPPVLEPDAQGLIKVPGSDFALLRLGTPGVIEASVLHVGTGLDWEGLWHVVMGI